MEPVTITEEHIRQGKPRSTITCPTALAIQDALNFADTGRSLPVCRYAAAA